jgi:hypothetical protein
MQDAAVTRKGPAAAPWIIHLQFTCMIVLFSTCMLAFSMDCFKRHGDTPQATKAATS